MPKLIREWQSPTLYTALSALIRRKIPCRLPAKPPAKALSLDANSAEALTAQAFIAYHFDYDWQAAERLFKRALELDSKSFIAHHWHGEFLNLTGKYKDGIAEIETALSLNPLSQAAYGDLAFGYYLARDYDKVVLYMNKSLETERNSAIARYNLSEFYEMQGKYDEAASEWLKAMALEEDDAEDIAALETAYKNKDFRRFSFAKAAWLGKINYARQLYFSYRHRQKLRRRRR